MFKFNKRVDVLLQIDNDDNLNGKELHNRFIKLRNFVFNENLK